MEQIYHTLPATNYTQLDNDGISSLLTIKIPYPPNFNARHVLKNIQRNPKPRTRTPNAYMIYRMGFNQEIRKKNILITMHQLSRISGNHWKLEPPQIKKHYKQMAKDVKELFTRECTLPNDIRPNGLTFFSNVKPTKKTFDGFKQDTQSSDLSFDFQLYAKNDSQTNNLQTDSLPIMSGSGFGNLEAISSKSAIRQNTFKD
ncbi:hypothetical protein G9A89_000926 [Geosiphon pyriformis]|nr:hypothetical protein G9A89_000926 [Geosiphon pyriformis]